MTRFLRLAAAAAFAALCAVSASHAAGDAAPPEAADAYRLGAGDTIKATVFGEPDLSGEFEIDGAGQLSLPLIGEVPAKGRTARELKTLIEERLRDGYLRKPRVSIEVATYRPFYITGEVNKPGPYPFVAGMTVVTAVALAGGYTYRANERTVTIRRGGGAEEDAAADETTRIMPGDVIRVEERFF